MAPEISTGEKYNGIKSDIHNLGKLLYNIITKEYNTRKIYEFIKSKNYEEFWDEINYSNLLSQSFKNLFVKMIAFNPDERPTIDQILNYEWMKEINNLSEDQKNALDDELKKELQKREAKLAKNNN